MPNLKIVPLPPRDTVNDAHCRERIQRFLDRVGELDSVAVAAVKPDGSVATTYYVGRSVFTMLGACDDVHERIKRDSIDY